MVQDARAIRIFRNTGGPLADVADDAPRSAGAAVAETGRERVGHRHDPVAFASLVAVAKANGLESLGRVEQFQHGQVAAAVGGGYVGVAALATGEADVDLCGL